MNKDSVVAIVVARLRSSMRSNSCSIILSIRRFSFR